MLIAKERLQDLIPAIAGKMKFRPAIVEKDYYLTVILNNIENLLSDKIVFKGGTLFNKVHLNYHRLSEDLDFTYLSELTARSQRSKAITPIREKMPAFLKVLGLTVTIRAAKGSITPRSMYSNFSILHSLPLRMRTSKLKYPCVSILWINLFIMK